MSRFPITRTALILLALGWPAVAACTIWPLPMYMPTWLTGE